MDFGQIRFWRPQLAEAVFNWGRIFSYSICLFSIFLLLHFSTFFLTFSSILLCFYPTFWKSKLKNCKFSPIELVFFRSTALKSFFSSVAESPWGKRRNSYSWKWPKKLETFSPLSYRYVVPLGTYIFIILCFPLYWLR